MPVLRGCPSETPKVSSSSGVATTGSPSASMYRMQISPTAPAFFTSWSCRAVKKFRPGCSGLDGSTAPIQSSARSWVWWT